MQVKDCTGIGNIAVEIGLGEDILGFLHEDIAQVPECHGPIRFCDVGVDSIVVGDVQRGLLPQIADAIVSGQLLVTAEALINTSVQRLKVQFDSKVRMVKKGWLMIKLSPSSL